MKTSTKRLIEQYEIIRASGETNMYDYFAVIRIARRRDFRDLAGISKESYVELLRHYSKYMHDYKIIRTGSNEKRI